VFIARHEAGERTAVQPSRFVSNESGHRPLFWMECQTPFKSAPLFLGACWATERESPTPFWWTAMGPYLHEKTNGEKDMTF